MTKHLIKSSILVLLACVVFSCSSPNYYVFKRVKVTPVQHNDKKALAEQEKQQPVEVASLDNSDAFVNTEKTTAPKIEADNSKWEAAVANVNQKLAITRDKIANGEKISKFEQVRTAMKVKRNMKKISKELEKEKLAGDDDAGGSKSQLLALILAFFLGYIGVHRFYLGYVTEGVIQLLTAGGCGVWTLIDLIRIITGDLKPKGGSYDPSF